MNKKNKTSTKVGISVAVGIFVALITYFIVGFCKANSIFKSLSRYREN